MTPALRILVVSDPHARVQALTEFRSMAAAVLRAAAESSPDLIVVTGDVLHEHAYVHTAAFNEVVEFLRELRLLATQRLFVLIGNHDLASNQVFLEPRHAFNTLKDWSGVEIVDRVVVHQGFWFVPYVPVGRFAEALATGPADFRSARAIFAHQEFWGARHGSHPSAYGDAWPSDAPLVVSGHFHEHQWLAPNLCYVGSPIAHDFGDEGRHGLSVFNFGELGPANSRFFEQRIDLGLPRRRTIELSVKDVAGGEWSPPCDDLLRLIVTGDSSELLAVRRSDRYREVQQSVVRMILRPEPRDAGLQVRPGETYWSLLRRYAFETSEDVRKLLDSLLKETGCS